MKTCRLLTFCARRYRVDTNKKPRRTKDLDVLKVLWGPAIGAVIGYFTNYIAVRMLFRPLRPVTLFGRRVPFTPGIIPKGKQRLARAIGSVVGETLLTKEDLQRTLLSDEMKNSLRESVDSALADRSDTTLRALCGTVMEETAYDTGRAVLQEKLTDVIAERLCDMQLGETIAREVLNAVRERTAGSLIGMMLRGDVLDSFAEPIRDGVDAYVNTNAYSLAAPQVAALWSTAEEKTVGDVNAALMDADISLSQIVLRAYEAMVSARAADLLRTMDLGGIAEEKVNALPPEELEQLVLSVMKKELTAVVNLGALVGFVLGLLNLIF
ncbi:MAG TPA: DUF445 domain-containing protein [Clostridiales bacterium]|nr:DUF445 domain-containing protein [Clostridiales bacterium]